MSYSISPHAGFCQGYTRLRSGRLAGPATRVMAATSPEKETRMKNPRDTMAKAEEVVKRKMLP